MQVKESKLKDLRTTSSRLISEILIKSLQRLIMFLRVQLRKMSLEKLKSILRGKLNLRLKKKLKDWLLKEKIKRSEVDLLQEDKRSERLTTCISLCKTESIESTS